tara:strand:- start:94490 stop:95188 length:699 start_codon:yes stop_codon:yes gene_type:complete
MKKLVIIPTYNEIENIAHIVPAVFNLLPEVHILVVDDSSPDGTAGKVEELQKTYPNTHLLVRKEKQGLGKAYLAGFDWGLEQGYDILCEMDADFSHRPQDLVTVLKEAEVSDVTIGSRYVPGGGTVNWGILRKIISKGGSLYSRIILGYPVNDWTGGFNAWKSEVLKGIHLDQVKSNGYCFQIELKYRALLKKYSTKEVPILFEDRRVGQSKMSLKIVLEAFYKVWLLRFTI